MPTIFKVQGPFKVFFSREPGGRTITDRDIQVFWEKNPELEDCCGCYVFGIRVGKGLIPTYVGKATKGFKKEVFDFHKLTRYQRTLAKYWRGTPILFFVVPSVKRGLPNRTHIAALEKFLIHTGQAANPGLLNIKGTKADEWGIAGVLRGGKGKAAHSALSFRRLMKLNGPGGGDSGSAVAAKLHGVATAPNASELPPASGEECDQTSGGNGEVPLNPVPQALPARGVDGSSREVL